MKRRSGRISRVVGPLLVLPTACLFLVIPSLQVKGAGQAQNLSEQEVRAAVETWVRYVTADARPDAVIERMEPHEVHGKTVAYIAHLEGGGFALCGANELVLPVYFYSPGGTYDPLNPDYQYILWEISARLETYQTALKDLAPEFDPYPEDLSERTTFWQELIAGRAPTRTKEPEGTRSEPTLMTLNLTSRWSQHWPYNARCPMGNGGRTVVGCVATAAAQIMRYWNWPPSGTGSHSYNWDGDDSCNGPVGGGTLGATFSDAYDWQNMPDDCISGCSQTQQDALSELSYEVGVAVEMDYGVCGSFAATKDIDNALESFFRYDPDATYGARNIDTMTEEVQWLRPVVLRGDDPINGGHAWVAYGYNKATGQFLMNLGSGGTHDGWYSCDDMDWDNDNIPNYDHDQHHVIRIAPENIVRFVGDDNPGDGSPGDPYQDIEEAIAEAQDGTTLIFEAGSTNTFSVDTLVIDRPFTLRGWDVIVGKQ